MCLVFHAGHVTGIVYRKITITQARTFEALCQERRLPRVEAGTRDLPQSRLGPSTRRHQGHLESVPSDLLMGLLDQARMSPAVSSSP
jgi:hypothetical protein